MQVSSDSIFDMDIDRFYTQGPDGKTPRPARINMMRPDGTVLSSEINSVDAIGDFMRQAGLLAAGTPMKPPVPVQKPIHAHTKPIVPSLADDLDNVLDAVLMPSVSSPVVPNVFVAPGASSSAAVAVPAVSPRKTGREKRVPDFKSIKMEWLKDKPAEPTICVKFSSEYGDFETYYHAVIVSEPVLYLIFDKRCKFGRFMPKMGGGLVDIVVGDELEGYSGTLWAEASFELGVLEITPFIVARDAEEVSVPDYD